MRTFQKHFAGHFPLGGGDTGEVCVRSLHVAEGDGGALREKIGGLISVDV